MPVHCPPPPTPHSCPVLPHWLIYTLESQPHHAGYLYLSLPVLLLSACRVTPTFYTLQCILFPDRLQALSLITIPSGTPSPAKPRCANQNTTVGTTGNFRVCRVEQMPPKDPSWWVSFSLATEATRERSECPGPASRSQQDCLL